jgi:hypothetical protein
MRALATFLAWLVLSCAAFACTGINASTTITAPGTYCLTANIFVTTPGQNGILITASNVTLDMQGKAIVGPGSGTGRGVMAIDKDSIAVRGGNIWGFHVGVQLELSDNSYVERMDVSGNTIRGIIVLGANAVIELNRVKGILGSSAFPTSHSMGIEVSGNNCNVRFNNVENIMPYGATEGVGISVSDFASGCQVYDNLVRFSAKPSTGRTFGVWVGGGVAPLSVHKNTILNADYGLFGYLATTTTTGNHSHQRCPTFWTVPSDFHTKNSIEYQGGCTDPEAGF